MWRHVPRGGRPLDFQYLLKAEGRWNRVGVYGALYTAETPACVAAEYRKRRDQYGIGRPRDLFGIRIVARSIHDLVHHGIPSVLEKERLRTPLDQPPIIYGDRSVDLEFCRRIADHVRAAGAVGLRAPSAADSSEAIFVLYPENDPSKIELEVARGPIPLNYGTDPYLGPDGLPTHGTP